MLNKEVTNVRCFSFHQIEEIFAVVLNKIGYAIAAKIDPNIINPNEYFANTLVQAPRIDKTAARIMDNLIFLPIAKFEGMLRRILETTKDNEHIVIKASLTLYALFNYT